MKRNWKQIVATTVATILSVIDLLANVAGINADLPGLLEQMSSTVIFEVVRWSALVVVIAAIWIVPWWINKRRGKDPPLDPVDLSGTWKHGKLADLDVVIRANEKGGLKRIKEWPELRHWLRTCFGDGLTDKQLWERFTDWLKAEKQITLGEYLRMPYSDAIKMLKKHARRGRG
jgi:hypothetical protein